MGGDGTGHEKSSNERAHLDSCSEIKVSDRRLKYSMTKSGRG
jgi:hypothetical protein